MKLHRFITAWIALIAATGAVSVPAQAQPAQPAATQPPAQSVTAREENAYTLAMQAYVFGYPYVYFQELRWKLVTQKPADPLVSQYAAVNHWWHQRVLTTGKYTYGGTPNTNLLYSITPFDVSKEPLIVTVPPIKDRYWTMEMVSQDSDNFAYVGLRTTGTDGGSYAIVGPNWNGKLPPGVKQVDRSRTNVGFIYGRTMVLSPADLKNAHAIQDKYKLTPLSLWGKKGAVVPEVHDAWKPFDSKVDPLADWKTMNRALAEHPPEARHQVFLNWFASIGVGPNLDVEKVDEPTKRALTRAARDANVMLRKYFAQGFGKPVGAWRYPPPTSGRAGMKEDFLTRAICAMIGNGINDPVESVYVTSNYDDKLEQLAGSKRYKVRFAPGGLPQVKAYWSVTLYDKTNNPVDNTINRWTLGTYELQDMKKDPDGGLTIYVQADSPGAATESNWLPSPKERPFYLVLRAYLPAESFLDQTWIPPAIERVM